MRTAILSALLLAAPPCTAFGAVPSSIEVVCDVPGSGPQSFKDLAKGQSQVFFTLWPAVDSGDQIGNDYPVAMDELLVTKVRAEKYDGVKAITFYRLTAVIGDDLQPVLLGFGDTYLDVTVGGVRLTCAVGEDKDPKAPPGPPARRRLQAVAYAVESEAAASTSDAIVASFDMNFSIDDRSAWTHIEALGDDNCFYDIPLGFTFNGFGASTSSISLSSNGLLFFGQSCSAVLGNVALPSGVSTDAFLAYFWDDLNDFGSGEYFEYATLGTPPGRVFNLYARHRLFSSNCGTDTQQVMVQIHEQSNVVNVTYRGFTSCVEMRGGSATLGLQSAGGTTAVMAGFNSPILDDNAPRQSMSFQPPS